MKKLFKGYIFASYVISLCLFLFLGYVVILKSSFDEPISYKIFNFSYIEALILMNAFFIIYITTTFIWSCDYPNTRKEIFEVIKTYFGALIVVMLLPKTLSYLGEDYNVMLSNSSLILLNFSPAAFFGYIGAILSRRELNDNIFSNKDKACIK